MTFNEIMNNRYTREYINMCKIVKRYYKESLIEPADVTMKYMDAIINYRAYLDSLGYKMSMPRYKYAHEDKSTWRYLDMRIVDDDQVRPLLNLDFTNK